MILAIRSAETYARCALLFERFLLENGLDLSRATPGLLDDYVGWLIRRKIMPTSIQLYVVGVRRYLEWRRRSGEDVPVYELPDIPVAAKGRRRPVIVLPDDVLARFLGQACCYTDPLRTMMLLLPMTGMRAEEVTQLELGSIVTRGDIPMALSVMGKGSKPRWVPVGRQGRKILQMFLQSWRSDNYRELPYLFPGKGGIPVRNRSLRKAITSVAKKIGAPRLHPHALRRTYVTYLSERGVPPLMIAQLIGHGRPLDPRVPAVTQKYVQHDLVTLCRVIEKITFPSPVMKNPEAA